MGTRVGESQPAEQRQAAALSNAKPTHLSLVVAGILFALAAAVAFLRLYRLSEFPPGLDPGEGANGLDALRVLQGEHAVYFPEKFDGREGLAMYAIALSISFLGRTELALRMPTALASAGTVFVVFWLGPVLFGQDEVRGRAAPWRGLLIGGIAAGLTAVSLSLTIMGRTAYRTSWLPFFLCLSLALLWQGWRQWDSGRGWWQLGLAGACAGLLPYTYIPARFVPFLFLFFGLSFLLPQRLAARSIDGAATQLSDTAAAIDRVRAEMPKILLFVTVAGLVAAPILVYFAMHPDHFFARSTHVSLFSPIRSHGNVLGAILVNVWDHLLVFGFRGDQNWRHNFAGRPLLNLVEALFFWVGVGAAVWRWQRRPPFRLLLLWLCLLILPALVASEGAPNSLRMIGAVPAIYLLVGVGIWEVWQFLKERFFPASGIQVALGMASLLGFWVLFQGVNTYRTYFYNWALAPETYEAYRTNWAELAQTMDARPPTTDSLYLIPAYTRFFVYSWQNGFSYLYQGTTPSLLVSAGSFNLAPAVESTLAEMENVFLVKFVDWDNDIVGGDAKADEQIVYLLGKYGRYQGSEDGASFRIHTYGDISLNGRWTFYDYLGPPTVHYDGGITLHGFAWGQGTEQLSSQQPFVVDKEEAAMWAAMQWEKVPELEIDYSVSLRLHNDEGGLVYQQDAVLRNPNSASTRHWLAGKAVDTLHYLELPDDLSPGEYELRLVVYDLESLKPTVEIGVWQPETVLARLHLSGVE